ncbi:MAG TPA: DUF488 domain-containing protein [Acidimicrobiia bacterium]
MKVWTIGFTQKSAEEFFGALRDAGIKRVLDIRLQNTSQLAGFTKKDDLEWFLGEILDAEYLHEPLLAPEEQAFKSYRKGVIDWKGFRKAYMKTAAERSIETAVDWPKLLRRRTVLLCSEPDAEHCHRRFVVDYLRDKGLDLEAIDL